MAKKSTLRVYLEAVSTPLERGLKKAKRMLKSFSSSVSSALGMVGLGLGAMAVKGMISDLDKLAKSARNLGVSGEYFQKMSFAADRSGVAVENVFSAFVKLKKGAGDAATGNAAMIENFGRLGLTVEDLRKLNPEQLFDEVALRLKNMQDPLERDSVAAALFGRNFAQLNVFLKDYKTLGDELEQRGGVISNKELAAAEKFDDTLANVAATLKSFAFNSGFISKINELVEGLEYIAGGAERLIAKSGGTQISREKGIEIALKSGKLTPEEKKAFENNGAYWVKGVVKDKNDVDTIDKAMTRLGFGGAGLFDDSWYGRMVSLYTPGSDTLNLPDWAGGSKARQALVTQKRQTRQTQIEEKAKQEEVKLATQRKIAADAEAERVAKIDDYIEQLAQQREFEALKLADPVAAFVQEAEAKFGKLSEDQRLALEEEARKRFENEEPLADETAKEEKQRQSTLGAWSAKNLNSQLGPHSPAERTATATEKSRIAAERTLTEVREIRENGLSGITYN